MVTWHQLGCVAGVIIGLAMLLPGGFNLVQSMYDTAPDESSFGCGVGVAGFVLIAVSIVGFWL